MDFDVPLRVQSIHPIFSSNDDHDEVRPFSIDMIDESNAVPPQKKKNQEEKKEDGEEVDSNEPKIPLYNGSSDM